MKKSRISQSLNRHLNAYTLAAGAAGVSMLAASAPAEARIITEQINFPLVGIQVYDFNPAHANVAPFLFQGSFINETSNWWNRAFFAPNTPGASMVLQSSNRLPADLAAGAEIGPNQDWGRPAGSGLLFTYGPYGGGTRNHHKGNFNQNGFLGFRVTISGKQYYGWIRLTFSLGPGPNGTKQVTTNIVNCAFQTTPNTPIKAGQTSDAAPVISKSVSPEASAEVQPASMRGSMGALALGAAGIPIWRQ